MYCVAGLHISFHRIGRQDWAPGAVLRSWAEATWRATPSGVALACAADETVWLGLGHNEAAATLVLRTASADATRRVPIPEEWQLGWLYDRHGQAVPIDLQATQAAAYRLDVERPHASPQPEPASTVSLELLLLSPGAWAERFGPIAFEAAVRPPPVPPYARIGRPRASARKPPG